MWSKLFSSLLTGLIIIFSVFITQGFAEGAAELPLLDDCVDLSVAYSHSEEVYPSVIDEESRAAYGSDYTMLMRKTLTPASVVYEIPSGRVPVFNTFFRQNEELAHFSFEASADAEVWTSIAPNIKIENAESWQWIPVTYSLKGLPDDTRYVKIIFSDKNGVEWSPMLASVYLDYKNITGRGFADCVGTEYDDVTAKLKSLGFITGFNDYEYRPFEALSRAELSVFCARLLALSGAAEQVFPDVAVGHFAADEIAALYHSKIVNGDENGLFNPDAEVTYTEAAKLLVCSLGFGLEAEDNGGYPIGYTTMASRLGLLDGLGDFDFSDSLSRGNAAVMLSNALESDMMYQTEFGEYQRYKRGELLSYYHNIDKIEGVVSSAGGLSVISEINSGEAVAVINDISYDMSLFDLTELLGVSVYAYVDRDSKQIIYAENKNSEIITLSISDEPEIKDGKLCYIKNNKQAEDNLDPNTRIIYNGRYKTRAALNENITLQSGDLKYIRNKGNGSDVILIWDYKSYVSSSDGYLDNPITTRLGDTLKIDTARAERIELLLYGETAELDAAYIHRGDVISIAESEDKKVIKIFVTTGSVSGTVNYFNKTDRVAEIDGQKYELTENCREINGSVSAGAQITAYIDLNGRIFAVEADNAYGYAYLISSTDNNPFGEVIVRVFADDGEIKEYTATAKTKLNGFANKLADIAYFSPQLVRIKVNSEDNIAALETALNSEGTTGAAEFICALSSDSCKYYGGSMRVFASKYRLDTNTKLFFIPTDFSDTEDYRLADFNSLYSDFSYKIKLYDVTDEYNVGAAVVFVGESDERIVSSYDNAAIIRSSAIINNAEGEPCLMLSVYIRGEEREIYFDNDGGIDLTDGWLPGYTSRITADGNNPFKTGEVIQYYSDSESHCQSFRMLLTREMIINNTFYEKNTADYGALTAENYFSELYSAYGRVKIRTADKLMLETDEDGIILRTIPLNGASVSVFNTQRNRLIKGDITDIAAGDMVFVRMSYADTLELLVIR